MITVGKQLKRHSAYKIFGLSKMTKTRKEFFCFRVEIILILIVLWNLVSAYTCAAESNSFVYCYGNVKIWISVVSNQTSFIGPKANGSIVLTIFLENLGSNLGVFINRLTFSLEGTQIRRSISPNVTLDTQLPSWTCNVTFGQEDVGSILIPGQVLAQNLNFEFRYDVIDSSREYWSYRVNESIPVTIQSPKQPAEAVTTFVTVFLVVSLFGVISVLVVLWLKIRSYKKKHAPKPDIASPST